MRDAVIVCGWDGWWWWLLAGSYCQQWLQSIQRLWNWQRRRWRRRRRGLWMEAAAWRCFPLSTASLFVLCSAWWVSLLAVHFASTLAQLYCISAVCWWVSLLAVHFASTLAQLYCISAMCWWVSLLAVHFASTLAQLYCISAVCWSVSHVQSLPSLSDSVIGNGHCRDGHETLKPEFETFISQDRDETETLASPVETTPRRDVQILTWDQEETFVSH